MHPILKVAGALILGAGLSASAWSVTITEGGSAGTNVGSVDTLLRVTDDLNEFSACGAGNSPTVETCWVNDTLEFLGEADTEFNLKTENVAIFETDADGVFAFSLVGAVEPEYFLVKNATFYALYQNVSSLSWGVIDEDDLPAGMNIGDVTVSHVDEFGEGDPGGPLPVPGSLALLGAGLVGAALIGRRRIVR